MAWFIETNRQRFVAGPYATVEHALQARDYFPYYQDMDRKLYVVEYDASLHPDQRDVRNATYD